jgi:hypothetical protein
MTLSKAEAMTNFQKYMAHSTCLNNCGRDAFCRGLCQTCYQYARRHNELDLYPIREVLDNTDDVIRQLFEYFPESVSDIAIEFGYQLVKTEL